MATKQETFKWQDAFTIANEIRSRLEPHFLGAGLLLTAWGLFLLVIDWIRGDL